ncbi:MAG: phosphonate degradation HD-domain oxygenase [Betaproteobacteria bacterium]
MALTILDIECIFDEHGHLDYAGEPVTQLQHALQAGALAEAEGAGDALITAAFLHDLGHMLNLQGDTPTVRGIDDTHQYFAIPFLRGTFGDDVLEPIRLHVDAKRALCALESDYFDALSEDSRRSLKLQGGIYSKAETDTFLTKPYAHDAMRLRRWDDNAKVAGLATPPLTHFLDIACRVTDDR